MHDGLAAVPDTILVVEDEVMVRLVIADYLGDCGYRVLEAGSVDEARDVLRAEPGIDLVFTDIQMPGDEDGCDLARWIGAHRNDVRVILTSGGTAAVDVAEDLCRAGPLIGKPYRLDAVRERIGLALAARERPAAAHRAAHY